MTQVGFCVISPWSLSRFLSNYKKALLRWLLHPHSNFQLIPPRVHSVGVTPYFTQIVSHNSVNVHQIPTKLGTEIHYNEPFKCAKFQPDWSMHSCFMADFAKCVKRSSRRKKNQTLAARISEMAGAIFFKFGM